MEQRGQTQYFLAPSKKRVKEYQKGKSGFAAKIVKKPQNPNFAKHPDISYPFYSFYPF
jgi:hypothetical protein